MSDHVVVKRDLLRSLIYAAEYCVENFADAESGNVMSFQAQEAKSILSAPSPEMVPWEEVEKLINAAKRATQEAGFEAHAELCEVLTTFNAKFKV